MNEIRAEDGVDAAKGQWGDAPLNPSLVGAWQAEAQAPQEDFGQPGAKPGQPADGGDGAQDFGGDQGDEDQGQDFGAPDEPDAPDAPPAPAAPGKPDMAKAFGLPVFKIQP